MSVTTDNHPRGSEAKPLAALLGGLTTGRPSTDGAPTANSRNPSPKMPFADEVACDRCDKLIEFEDGTEVEHRCCTCQDAGFVRYERKPTSEDFGRALPCPDCSKRPSGLNSPERVVVRMRIPAKFRDARIGTWQPANGRPRMAAQDYVAQWPPVKPLLLLSGTKGVGKTHIACGILHEVFERHGKRGQFWPVVDLLDRYRATFDEDRATETVETVDAQLRQLPVLVLDDFGTHKSSEWAEERLFRLVDERYRDLRPLVVTTNAGLLELPDRVKSRLADGSCSTLIQVSGPDRRLGA